MLGAMSGPAVSAPDASARPSPASPAPRVLFDCDPGHDDVIAIIVAARHAQLVGITTVAGNAPLDRTTYNALVMRDMLRIDVPIHSGADRPLVRELEVAPDIHGASGLDGADLPAPTTPLDGTDAVRFIVDSCHEYDDLWLVPTGPLTNIALALRGDPSIAQRVAGISLMGGGSFGNRTPVGEFNMWDDPDAAAEVFACGAPIVMAGLDVTHQFRATPARIARLRAIGGTLAATLADLLTFFSDMYLAAHDEGAIDGAAIHDPLAVLALTHPGLFTRAARHVAVETAGELTRGMTVIDERRVAHRPKANTDVLTKVDSDQAYDIVIEAVEHFSG
jgi:inosine-uridine nucleoside N-ribohydrolase